MSQRLKSTMNAPARFGLTIDSKSVERQWLTSSEFLAHGKTIEKAKAANSPDPAEASWA